MSRWARNVDTTHGPIRDALRKAGWQVIDTSRVGGGFPDLIVASAGRTLLVECKTSRNKAGTVEPKRVEASQIAFAACWRGEPVLMATTPESAVAAVSERLRASFERSPVPLTGSSR